MSTVEHFKSYVALTIERLAAFEVFEKAATEGKPTLGLFARYGKKRDEADAMLANWFTTSGDLVTVRDAMELDYELAETGNACEQERRLAFCRYGVALRCQQLEIPDLSDDELELGPEYRAVSLREENDDVISEIHKFILSKYLGY